MTLRETSLRDVKILQPRRHGDQRGWFAELFNADTFAALGLPSVFAQDNQSFSARGVLRGLHYQLGHPQGKLVRVLSGHIWDVAVDLRRDSPDFGRWAAFDLKPLNDDGELELLWIPEGFAHGFLVLSETAEVLYKTTRGYYPPGERCVLWNDPELGISWPLEQIKAELPGAEPAVSAKDAKGALLRDAELP
ncbi:MAG TPA: dTDP-4-dehydrorhamnose 3,5-epimerase [Acidobacteriaceae bacterium]|nr:dTDP-4-dehydrorhamnose 3,5-epimerase [Acidobacteriaceae bacterium]